MKVSMRQMKSGKLRLHMDSLYVIYTFMGMESNEELCIRAQSLPVKNKVFFVNHFVDQEKYPNFFILKVLKIRLVQVSSEHL